MQSEEPLIYNFKFNGGWDNVFSFNTKHGVEYLVRFKPSVDYVSPEEYWRHDFYEILIDVAAAPNPATISADRAIFPTIVAIITRFFESHERVILYICDDSDSRELARQRKFNTWYRRSGVELYEKYDLPMVATESERYFMSIFFRRDNPNRIAILDAFNRLVTGTK